MTVIDDVIEATASVQRERLIELRDIVRELAPEASEKIAYGIPTWYLNGNLVHIAAFARHVSLFPGEEGVAAFADELGGLVHSKGTIQFPLDAPLPVDLVRRIVAFRAAQQRAAPPRRGRSRPGP